MNAFILGLKHDIEQLKDGRANLVMKASNQELIIDRQKNEIGRLQRDVEGIRSEKKRLEEQILRGNQKEVTLTAERETAKRELELMKESSKRELDLVSTQLRESKSEVIQLRSQLDCERSKRQKLRSSYRKLNESLNGQDETTGPDVRNALEQLREGLME